MPNISQRITLEGGAEFRNALAQIGTTAQQAFGTMSTAINAASSVATRIAPIVDAVQKKLADLRNAGQQLNQSLGTTAERFRTAGTRLAVLAAGVAGANGGFLALIANSGKAAEDIEVAARAAGLTTAQYQDMSGALSVAGIETGEFSALMNRMNRSFGDNAKRAQETARAQRDLNKDFTDGKITAGEYVSKLNDMRVKASEATDVFSKLGVSAETAGGDSREAFLQAIDGLSRMKPGIEQTSAAMELAGRNGTKLLAIVGEGGREAFLEFEASIKRVNPRLTEFQLAVGNKLDDAFDKVRLAATNTQRQFFLLFGPATTTLLNAITEAIVRNRDVILQFGSAVLAAFDPLIKKATDFINAFTLDPATFAGIASSIQQFGADVVTTIGIAVAAWNTFVAALDLVAQGINALFGTNLNGRVLAFVVILGTITGVFSAIFAAVGTVISAVSFLVAAFGGLNLVIAAVGVALGFIFGQGLIAAVTAATTFMTSAANTISTLWTTATNTFRDAWNSAIDFITGKWDGFKNFVLQGIAAIIAAAKQIGGAFGFGGGGGESPGFARGGQVRGPGTGTSDSILARLSDGEYVVKAKAVRHYGVDLLNALNNMRIPSPAFALGGLVSALEHSMPRQRFATGGLVTAPSTSSQSGRPLFLKIGDQTFGPMSAPENVATDLERFATGKALRSAGRKPSWA